MRLNRFISSLILSAISTAAAACGAFDALVSNPFTFHFYQEEDAPTVMDVQREENVALWQSLTSESIPASHVESAVYGMTLRELATTFFTGQSDNMFLKWIIVHKSVDIKDFLLLAKELEELRFNRVSKWYYPTDRTETFDSENEAERFASVMERCRRHAAGPLSDRYALQYMRALFALGKYDEVIEFYDKKMKKLPEVNLFRRMARGYVAGSLRHLGYGDEANRIYAEIGDINSIIGSKRPYFIPLVENNPECPVVKSNLTRWVGRDDREYNLPFLAVADAALSSPRVVNRGDWLYLKAYIEEIYNDNHAKAISYLKQALDATFSKEEMRHDAEEMKLCLDAATGSLCKDLRQYLPAFQTESVPFYFYIVPALLREGRVSEAMLIANYASGLKRTANQYRYSLTNDSYAIREVTDDAYANTGFQLMLSRSAREVIEYKKYLSSTDPLVRECIGRTRHDDDYLNEIIGTLLLREGDYAEAEKYFSLVSDEYQENLNVKKCGYLYDNPWVNCYMPGEKWDYPSAKGEAADEEKSPVASFNPENSALLKSNHNAKLNFAREMSRLAGIMKTGSPDERGLARIRYALARYNSFESCWALTQYWRGEANQCNYRPFYWLWNWKYRELDYLKEVTGPVPDEKWLNAEIQRGIKELQSPEAQAEAQFLAGNYRTIAKKYPSTYAGKYLSTHCDAWHDWL